LQKLSERTGLNVTLPSEKQWEWACRAGSDSPFWYGNFNDNFAPYENMADRQLNKMAVTGVDPQPMSENNPWYKYYTWHPKEESVDDGNMLAVAPGGYKPNPWGCTTCTEMYRNGRVQDILLILIMMRCRKRVSKKL
jgi:formylglycine-generating enzyme required for sulfatase activity